MGLERLKTSSSINDLDGVKGEKMELTYEEVLRTHGEEAAKAFLEWQLEKVAPKPFEITGDPIHDYLVEKGRIK